MGTYLSKRRVLMGIDLGIGLIAYVAISWLFGEPFQWSYLAWSIGCAFLPDVDMIIYLLFRKRMQWSSHHLIHFPVLFLGAGILIGWQVSPYMGTLLVAATMGHFIHDMWTSQQGIRWLWPLSDTGITMKYRDRPGRFGLVSGSKRRRMYQRWWQARSLKGGYSLKKEVAVRWEPMGLRTRAWLFIGGIATAGYAFFY